MELVKFPMYVLNWLSCVGNRDVIVLVSGLLLRFDLFVADCLKKSVSLMVCG